MVVLCGVNLIIIHFSEASIPSSFRSSIHPFSSNHPGAKSLVPHGIQSILCIPQPAAQDLCLLFCLILQRAQLWEGLLWAAACLASGGGLVDGLEGQGGGAAGQPAGGAARPHCPIGQGGQVGSQRGAAVRSS